ncbi:MAG TPA: hypothetical protein VK177_04665 [Flavobacteriales bacterium]|nr:hypothetical protein [Flavobacteriales bacterium]
MKNLLYFFFAAAFLIVGCKKDEPEPTPPSTTPADVPELVFKFKFDSTQVRLDAFGNPCTVPAGHAAQSPKFNTMSAHYIELSPSATTAVGAGAILYHAPETSAGGSTAIDFNNGIHAAEGVIWKKVPISSIAPGTYNYLRVSLAYQNYDIKYKYSGSMYTGTLASFVGYKTYLSTYTIKTQTVTVNANKLQGYWGFETFGTVFEGEAPGTTVVNPLFATSPIPAGSCLATGQFAAPLVITGSETNDIVITISLSTNNSFEWEDDGGDGLYEPTAGDSVVDMGLRGLIPIVE